MRASNRLAALCRRPSAPGQRVVSGGYSTPSAILALDSYPESDTSWRIYLVNLTSSSVPFTVYATCVVAETGTGYGRSRAGLEAGDESKGVRSSLGNRIGANDG